MANFRFIAIISITSNYVTKTLNYTTIPKLRSYSFATVSEITA